MNRTAVKKLRESLGITQEEFAARIPVSTKTVSRWELGEVSPSPLARMRLRDLHRKIHASKPEEPTGTNPDHVAGMPTPNEPRRRGVLPSSE
jgi:transcriptional regulator with XRE-family HTH domain